MVRSWQPTCAARGRDVEGVMGWTWERVTVRSRSGLAMASYGRTTAGNVRTPDGPVDPLEFLCRCEADHLRAEMDGLAIWRADGSIAERAAELLMGELTDADVQRARLLVDIAAVMSRQTAGEGLLPCGHAEEQVAGDVTRYCPACERRERDG